MVGSLIRTVPLPINIAQVPKQYRFAKDFEFPVITIPSEHNPSTSSSSEIWG
jgi:hypothetical protein